MAVRVKTAKERVERQRLRDAKKELQEARETIQALNLKNQSFASHAAEMENLASIFKSRYAGAQTRVEQLEDHVRYLRHGMATTWRGNDVLRKLLTGSLPLADGRSYRDHCRDEVIRESFGIVSEIPDTNLEEDCPSDG